MKCLETLYKQPWTTFWSSRTPFLCTEDFMSYTASREYRVPGRLYCLAGDLLLRTAKWIPQTVRTKFIRDRSYYQTFSEIEVGDHEGLSIRKWEAMRMPSDLTGKSVLDIGCSEGFFCRQVAKRGARRVVGIDTGLGRLMCASFMALEERIRISYRMDVFPTLRLDDKYDYVLCLSVLHHSLSTKDVWKVLTLDEFARDRLLLREQLRLLRSLTADGR